MAPFQLGFVGVGSKNGFSNGSLLGLMGTPKLAQGLLQHQATQPANGSLLQTPHHQVGSSGIGSANVAWWCCTQPIRQHLANASFVSGNALATHNPHCNRCMPTS